MADQDSERLFEDVQREAERISNKFYNIGYREGFFQGKSETTQQAFDIGFYYGALKSLKKPSINRAESFDIPPNVPTLEEIETEHKSFVASIKEQML